MPTLVQSPDNFYYPYPDDYTFLDIPLVAIKALSALIEKLCPRGFKAAHNLITKPRPPSFKARKAL
ncbi:MULTISPECIES: hypothetical protein [Bartonella]|uniref:hypothetical protein n=1 Tax=Bartonella TaxID=773 RepID=UPI0018DE3593|nr:MULTISPECIES: hypothetical protein [Bartonella]MBI0168704.1 hypothetical protein [Bartonella sp. W8167]MBI0175308.1 hypothetical protein [Bartonella apis]